MLSSASLNLEVPPLSTAPLVLSLRLPHLLDQAAIAVVLQWQFIPGHLDWEPVKVEANVNVHVRLSDSQMEIVTYDIRPPVSIQPRPPPSEGPRC